MAANSLMSRMLKIHAKDPKVNVLASSTFFDKDIIFQSCVAMINGMMSGNLSGPEAGIRPGLTVVVGDSRTFKTNFCLSQAKDFLDSDPEAVLIFGDCEFGAKSSFESFGIDKNRVIHIALENIEDLKFKIVQTIAEVATGDKVMVFIDSVSQIASKKEIEDAMNENAAADMTRAKQLNSFFRMITPSLMIKKIPCLVINSYYDDVGNKYADKIIKGGKQIFLSADTLLMVSRSQVKDDEGLKGWNFNYSIMKSRYVREKSKFSLTVTYEGGIDKNSGLFELAQEAGIIYSEKQGFYLFRLEGFVDGKSYRKSAIEDNQPFFDALVKDEGFNIFFRSKYGLEDGGLYRETPIVDDDGVILNA